MNPLLQEYSKLYFVYTGTNTDNLSDLGKKEYARFIELEKTIESKIERCEMFERDLIARGILEGDNYTTMQQEREIVIELRNRHIAALTSMNDHAKINDKENEKKYGFLAWELGKILEKGKK